MAARLTTTEFEDQSAVTESAFYRASFGAILGWFAGALVMLVLGWTLGYAALGGEDTDETPVGEFIQMVSVGAFAGTFLGAAAGLVVAFLRGRARTAGKAAPSSRGDHIGTRSFPDGPSLDTVATSENSRFGAGRAVQIWGNGAACARIQCR